ncbi:hypothetical protein Bca4012_033442 [Brassica carinata]
MGQSMSCGARPEHEIFASVQRGDIVTVRRAITADPSVLRQTTAYDRHSLLHVAAASGHIEVLSFLLERSSNPDMLNRHKQTPLMLAAMHGRISCIKKLAQVGANVRKVLMFDSVNRRTCLHYAAYYGHADCVQAILSAARSTPVALHWGYARFVNLRDDKGATPLHLAARQRSPDCVNALLDSGSLVCASTSLYWSPGSTALHLAARSGSIDCVRKLLAWGADRLQRDGSGKIPYVVAMKYKHGACGALLNPSSAEPLVWPSPLKFISELNEEAKLLLEQALMDANMEREKAILNGTDYSLPSPPPSFSDTASDDDNMSEMSDSELCCICFEQVCTIEVKDCGHQMCAQCTLALCCHNKPNPTTSTVTPPVCPFCRSVIARLVVAQNNNKDDRSNSQDEVGDVSSSKLRKHRKSINLGEEGSSFMGLSSIGSFGKVTGRGSGRITADNELMNKPIS